MYDKKYKLYRNWVTNAPGIKPDVKGRCIINYDVDKFFMEYLSKKVIF